MQQTVETAEIDKHAIFSDVLDLALDNLVFGEGLEEGGALGIGVLLQEARGGTRSHCCGDG